MSEPQTEPTFLFEDRQTHGERHVQWTADDGGFEMAIFSGPKARERAIKPTSKNWPASEPIFVFPNCPEALKTRWSSPPRRRVPVQLLAALLRPHRPQQLRRAGIKEPPRRVGDTAGSRQGWKFRRIGVDQQRCKFSHSLDLHVAVLQQPLVVLLEQNRADKPGDA